MTAAGRILAVLAALLIAPFCAVVAQVGPGPSMVGNPIMPPPSFATLDPATMTASGTGVATLDTGNLRARNLGSGASSTAHFRSTQQLFGKVFFVVTFTDTQGGGYLGAGIINAASAMPTTNSSAPANTWILKDTGNKNANAGGDVASGTGAFANTDIAMYAIDVPGQQMWVGKNGTWQGDPSAGTSPAMTGLPATMYAYCNVFWATNSGIQLFNLGATGLPYATPTAYRPGLFR